MYFITTEKKIRVYLRDFVIPQHICSFTEPLSALASTLLENLFITDNV